MTPSQALSFIDNAADSGLGAPDYADAYRLVKETIARVEVLEGCLEAVLWARPWSLECDDFNRATKDQHEGFDCPCLERWDAAVEAATDILAKK